MILQMTVTMKAASAALVCSVGGHPSLPKDFLLCDSSILLSSYLIVCLSPLVPSRIPCPISACVQQYFVKYLLVVLMITKMDSKRSAFPKVVPVEMASATGKPGVLSPPLAVRDCRDPGWVFLHLQGTVVLCSLY